MATIIVDGIEIEIGDEERLNGVEAAARVGIDIPRYCWHPGLSVVASCRMCLVETGRRDAASGEISMLPKLVPACQTPATDGTVFVTNSEKVRRARAMVEEDLLLRHPVDCPICDKAGECLLQDYHFQYGRDERRADIKPFTSRREDLGPTVTLFVDRCILCGRCTRFTHEVTGTDELMRVHRGAHQRIDVFPGYPLDNKLSLNVVDLCPVGALAQKDFLYRQRVWFMESHPGVCAGCSTGCSTLVDENQDRVYRIRPRENPHVNQWWMCDEGRVAYKQVHDTARVTRARRRDGDSLVELPWTELPHLVDQAMRAAGQASGRLAAVLSPHLTVEEAFLLARYVKRLDGEAILAVGPVPVAGEDESFPGGFTIGAEKCPNRRGVEAVVAGLGRELLDFDGLLARVDSDEVSGVWVTGGYAGDREGHRFDAAAADRLAKVPTLVVHDLFASPLWDRATFQIPGAAFAERAGSYVNGHNRLQSFDWAVRPPCGVATEGHLFWRLDGRQGMYDAGKVREEVAREIAFFAPAAGSIPEVGVDLKGNLLA